VRDGLADHEGTLYRARCPRNPRVGSWRLTGKFWVW
jgi:hypothetical protein